MSVVLMVMLVAFVLRQVCGTAMGPMGVHGRRRHRGMRDVLGMDVLEAARPVQAVPTPRAESPLESLQRRFSAGTISVEEYEREVGKLYGLK